MFNIKMILIVVGVAFGAGTFLGGSVVWKLWSASNDSKMVKDLQLKLKARDVAAAEDTKRAVEDALEAAKINKEQDEVISHSTDDRVLVGPAAGRLRDLWN